jgi:hypothetical protein
MRAGRDVPAAFPLAALGAAVLERNGLIDVIGEDRLSMTLSTAVAAHHEWLPRTED